MDLRHFSLKNFLWLFVLVYLIVLFIWVELFVFFGSHNASLLGQLGSVVVLAPIPLLFVFSFILAYGEWLYNEIQAYRSDRSVWIKKRLSRLQKFLIFAVVVGFLALILAIFDDEVYRQIKTLLTIGAWKLLRNFLIALLFLFSFSVLSSCAYNLYLKRKKKRYEKLKTGA